MTASKANKQLLQSIENQSAPITFTLTFEFTKEKVQTKHTLPPTDIVEYIEDVERRGLVLGKHKFERYYPAHTLEGVTIEWS